MTSDRAGARERLLAAARRKPTPPYELDPSLTFFCPQENVEGLSHPSVQALRDFKRERWQVPKGGRRVLLLVPCQLTKPYPLSREHQAINRAFLEAGFKPTGKGDWPRELGASGIDPDLLSNAPLADESGLVVDRAVISEPFGLVPYEVVYKLKGELSPVARYDDPGLFEHRGIGPVWRDDCTAVEVKPGWWRWGDNERASYAEMHNALATEIVGDLKGVRDSYQAIFGCTAPGMPHRSFLAKAEERREGRMPLNRRAHGRNMRLVGVGDIEPGMVRLFPSAAEFARHRQARGGRLTSTPLQDASILSELVASLRAAGKSA